MLTFNFSDVNCLVVLLKVALAGPMHLSLFLDSSDKYTFTSTGPTTDGQSIVQDNLHVFCR